MPSSKNQFKLILNKLEIFKKDQVFLYRKFYIQTEATKREPIEYLYGEINFWGNTAPASRITKLTYCKSETEFES